MFVDQLVDMVGTARLDRTEVCFGLRFRLKQRA